jgi:hypothetical protein
MTLSRILVRCDCFFLPDFHRTDRVCFRAAFQASLPHAFHDIERHRMGDTFEPGLKGPFYCQGLLKMVGDHLGNHHLAVLGLPLDAMHQVHRSADNVVFGPALRADVPSHLPVKPGSPENLKPG